MEIEVKGCLSCPMLTHHIDLDQDFEWMECNLLTEINGHSMDSDVYDGDLSDVMDEDRVKTPNWCPLKEENVTIKMSS